MKQSTTSHRDNPLRREIARLACFEVDYLAKMLREHIEVNDSSGELASAMRSGLMRLSDLSTIIHETAITDEAYDTDEGVISAIGGRVVLSEEFRGEAA